MGKDAEIHQCGCGFTWVISNENYPENNSYATETTYTFEIKSKYELKGGRYEWKNGLNVGTFNRNR